MTPRSRVFFSEGGPCPRKSHLQGPQAYEHHSRKTITHLLGLLGLGRARGLICALLSLLLLLLLGATTEHGKDAVRGLSSGILGSLGSILSSIDSGLGHSLLALAGGGLGVLLLNGGGGVGLGLRDVRHDE